MCIQKDPDITEKSLQKKKMKFQKYSSNLQEGRKKKREGKMEQTGKQHNIRYVITLNVNDLNTIIKRQRLFEWGENYVNKKLNSNITI